jgi:hypothetical protein
MGYPPVARFTGASDDVAASAITAAGSGIGVAAGVARAEIGAGAGAGAGSVGVAGAAGGHSHPSVAARIKSYFFHRWGHPIPGHSDRTTPMGCLGTARAAPARVRFNPLDVASPAQIHMRLFSRTHRTPSSPSSVSPNPRAAASAAHAALAWAWIASRIAYAAQSKGDTPSCGLFFFGCGMVSLDVILKRSGPVQPRHEGRGPTLHTPSHAHLQCLLAGHRRAGPLARLGLAGLQFGADVGHGAGRFLDQTQAQGRDHCLLRFGEPHGDRRRRVVLPRRPALGSAVRVAAPRGRHHVVGRAQHDLWNEPRWFASYPKVHRSQTTREITSEKKTEMYIHPRQDTDVHTTRVAQKRQKGSGGDPRPSLITTHRGWLPNARAQSAAAAHLFAAREGASPPQVRPGQASLARGHPKLPCVPGRQPPTIFEDGCVNGATTRASSVSRLACTDDTSEMIHSLV